MKIQDKEKFYTPFDLDNTTLRFMVHEKIDGPFGEMHRVSISTDTYFRLGDIHVPTEFIKQLPNCVLKEAEYAVAKE